jgi:hypothetical protein
MGPSLTVLLYGRDRSLLNTRELILQKAGYRVWTAADLSEIDRAVQGERVDLLILCHSLTLEQCGRALAFCHSRWPFTKSLLLAVAGSWCAAGKPELVFEAAAGPAELLATVGRLFAHPRVSKSTLNRKEIVCPSMLAQ